MNGTKPSRLGHFEIRDEIARGGMGIVYRGWHAELKREVAVKCIRAGEFADKSAIERFSTRSSNGGFAQTRWDHTDL